jgi:hypothetical protein
MVKPTSGRHLTTATADINANFLNHRFGARRLPVTLKVFHPFDAVFCTALGGAP